MRLKLNVKHEPRIMTGFKTKCCNVDAEVTGNSGHKRYSQRVDWVRCPHCNKEGWAGDDGYVPAPNVPLKMPWCQ